jgi:hypothetical protein
VGDGLDGLLGKGRCSQTFRLLVPQSGYFVNKKSITEAYMDRQRAPCGWGCRGSCRPSNYQCVRCQIRQVRLGGLRRESDGRSDATSTLFLWQIKGVCARAGCATEGVLLHVGEAAMAQLLLLASLGAESCVADQHAETLIFKLGDAISK